ncbi:MAG: flagellin [Phycisphaerae bacterium]|jgi:flagellin
MSRINTNIESMIATRVLNHQNQMLNQSLARLSTGLRINSGKDDPAGLIASEALRSEKIAIGSALVNISRANNVIGTSEGALDEINKLLTELEDLVDRSANEAGISEDERQANQLQIDAILDSINRIAASTEFQGKKLLNGELDYATSGVDSTNFADVTINSARIAADGNRAVVVEVTQSADVARLTYAASATGAGVTTIEIGGNRGTETLSFASGTAISAVAAAVNQAKDVTGVSASLISGGTALQFYSTEYGSNQFVTVQALQGAFTVTGGDAADRDYGVDASVLVNGVSANANGLDIEAQTSTLSVAMRLTAAFGTSLGSDTFHVTGGGADFMISPTVSFNGLASIGIPSVGVGSLGSNSNGFLATLRSGETNSLDSGHYDTAQRIIREAQTQVSRLRGRLGAFQRNTLETTANALNITLENTTAAESAIRDTDFAVETSALTRSQIMVQSATAMLRLANAQPQQVLSLLS